MKHTLDEVVAVVREVAAEHSDRVDARAQRGLPPRYTEHGEPCCLVAEVLTRLGWSVAQLKQLDHEAGRREGGIKFAESNSRLLRRIDPTALNLLDHIQRGQDRARTWGEVISDAFTPDTQLHLRRGPTKTWIETERR